MDSGERDFVGKVHPFQPDHRPGRGFYPLGCDYRGALSKPECLWRRSTQCPKNVLLPKCRGCPQGYDHELGALLLTALMLMVGAALFAYYEPMRAQGTEPAIFGQDNNFVYPVWIVTELPVSLRGLILAGIFAAAISSLDSILAALSQTTLSLFRDERKQGREKRDLWISRLLVLVWGVLLSAFAVELDSLRGKVNVVVLAFGMISYTTGPMLGIFLAALFTPRASRAWLDLRLFPFLCLGRLPKAGLLSNPHEFRSDPS